MEKGKIITKKGDNKMGSRLRGFGRQINIMDTSHRNEVYCRSYLMPELGIGVSRIRPSGCGTR
jgi:hypothetical protein